MCGSSIPCWVDLAGTGSAALAGRTKKDVELLKEKQRLEGEIAFCGAESPTCHCFFLAANTPPEFEASVILCNITARSNGSCSIAASDQDRNDTVTVTLLGIPTWMHFDASENRLSWTTPPDSLAKDGLKLIAQASDTCGAVTAQPVIVHLCACEVSR